MRDYGTIPISFWTSGTASSLTDCGKLLAFYLLAGPHTTQIGCFRLPDAYAADDLRWSQATVSEGFAELFRNGFATRDEALKWVLVRPFLEWNRIENPNQGKACAKLFVQVPNGSPLKPELAHLLRVHGRHFPHDVLDDFETVRKQFGKGFRNQEQEQEQEQDQEQEDPSQEEKPNKVVQIPRARTHARPDPIDGVFQPTEVRS